MDDFIIDQSLIAMSSCLLAQAAKIRKRRLRKFKVRTINKHRSVAKNGQIHERMKNMDAESFFEATRMTMPIFEELLEITIKKMSRQRRSSGICTADRLLITLQYLSQGPSMQSLAKAFHLGLSTVQNIIHETCQTLWDILSPDYLKTPSRKEWLKISSDFEKKWNFPHCLGALHGKHIIIANNAIFSIVLFAACDANYLFSLVDVVVQDSQSDIGILKNSVFGQCFDKHNMNVPDPSNITGTNISIPYFFVAGEAFPLKEHIMRPFPGARLNKLTHEQNIFNEHLARVRQTAENTFGILMDRWKILKTLINCKAENVGNIVRAAVVLHNYCKMKSGNNMYCPAGFMDEDGAWKVANNVQSVQRLASNNAARKVFHIRDALCEYFLNSVEKSTTLQQNIDNQ